MPGQFLHGVEVVELNGGARPVRTVKSSVIGMVGTAPTANAEKFPINTPVLIAGSRTEAAALGTRGTLPPALDGIFDQAGPWSWSFVWMKRPTQTKSWLMLSGGGREWQR